MMMEPPAAPLLPALVAPAASAEAPASHGPSSQGSPQCTPPLPLDPAAPPLPPWLMSVEKAPSVTSFSTLMLIAPPVAALPPEPPVQFAPAGISVPKPSTPPSALNAQPSMSSAPPAPPLPPADPF